MSYLYLKIAQLKEKKSVHGFLHNNSIFSKMIYTFLYIVASLMVLPL